jgi:glycosyltransferase involved in cell wall biosynthesis
VPSPPRVSVIIPVFNLRDYVATTIESALAQTLPADEVEIVVIDDGSTDGSAEIAQRYVPSVRYVHQENQGLSAARNRGIREACGPMLSFLDADDRMLPGKLAAELEAFQAHPEVGLVYSGFHYIDAAGALLPQRGWARYEGDVFPELVQRNLIHPVQALVRREPVERAGGFDETLTSVEDWDLWLRITRPGLRWACVDEPLAEYRIRTDSMHQNPVRMADNWLRVLDRTFDDPSLPPHIVELKPRAYYTAYMIAACDHYREGDRQRGGAWFRKAIAERPEALTDPESLRMFCRLLLPRGYQRTAVMAAHWRRLAETLTTALGDLFTAADLPADIADRRWRARIASWRALAPLVGKRVRTAMRRHASDSPLPP